MEAIISVQHLTKSFKDFKAVDDLSFSIQPGAVYGFLGENGAGKSTTMRLLLGLIHPDNGKIFIKGKQFNNSQRHLLKHIGAIIERPDMYSYLSGWDNLRMFAKLSDVNITVARLEEVLELVGLKGREKDKVKAYSQGMKQRLGIAIALAHDPELLILDEPTNGLDPQGIAEMRALILHLSKDQGKTIVISSHLLHEIEQVATEMLIIHKGKKVIEGNVQHLLDPKETLFDVKYSSEKNLQVLIASSEWSKTLMEHTTNKLSFKLHPSQMPSLNKWLVAQDVAVMEIRSRHSLEAYFLSLTNDSITTTGTV